MTPFQICKPEDCTGCFACRDICPTSSISVVLDNLGHTKPVINNKTCVNCLLCKKVCQNNNFSELNKPLTCLVFKGSNKVRKSSQSGGAFQILGIKALKASYVVYGVTNANKKTFYKRVQDTTELNALLGSKYVQSDTMNVYKQVEKDIKTNHKVLFSGTPCIISALKAYLKATGSNTDNLLTVEILCFGVPSQYIFEEFLKNEEKIKGDKIAHFIFRDKQWSLNEKFSRIIWENNSNDTLTDGYLKLFSSRLVLRDSCYHCKYSNEKRGADITIGDCWAIDKIKPSFDDNRGISLVMLNTEKGQEFFNQEKLKAKFFSTSFDLISIKQPTLKQPIQPEVKRNDFISCYHQSGLIEAMNAFCDYNSAIRVDIKGKRIITKNKKFLSSYRKGIIKKYFPPFLKPIIYRIKKLFR